MIEAALSYLGLGVTPPTPSLGALLTEGQGFMTTQPLMVLFLGLALTLGVFGLSGYLKLLGVQRDARGQGVGAALLAHVEGRARDDGQGHLVLLVSDFNLPAQRFYAAHGYRRVGAIPDYVCPSVEELIYIKRLHEETR